MAGCEHRSIRGTGLLAWAARHLLLIASAAATVLPLGWLVLAAMRPGSQTLANPFAWPERLTIEPFLRAWNEGEFGSHFLASAVTSAASVLLTLLTGALAGFALARFRVRGSGLFTNLLLLGFLIPTEALVLSLSRLAETLGIDDTWLALIGPYTALQLPLAILVYRGFFVSIPESFHEAARLDGANTWQVFWRVFFPMAAPATAVVGIVTFLSVWNEFLLATLLISTPERQLLPAAFNAFYGHHHSDFQLILAGLTVYVAPAVVVYLVFNRVIARSVAEATLKG